MHQGPVKRKLRIIHPFLFCVDSKNIINNTSCCLQPLVVGLKARGPNHINVNLNDYQKMPKDYSTYVKVFVFKREREREREMLQFSRLLLWQCCPAPKEILILEKRILIRLATVQHYINLELNHLFY